VIPIWVFLITLLAASGIAFSSAQAPATLAQPTIAEGTTQNAPGRDSNHNVSILSDTKGADFSPYLKQWHSITDKTWQGIMPKEVDKPELRSGFVMIRFKVMPDGHIKDMVLEGRSGSESLDRAAWYAITRSSYPPLPKEFTGPYLEFRTVFMYNEKPPQKSPPAPEHNP
jgi:TonB family protein